MRRGFGLIWVAITAVIAGVASYFSYEAGLSQGLASKLPAAGAAPYYWYGPHFGFGFFPFFGLIWFFLILFLIMWFVRAARWGRHGGGRWNYEERLHEWHREAHEQPGSGEAPKQ
jgi:hypothetical protein